MGLAGVAGMALGTARSRSAEVIPPTIAEPPAPAFACASSLAAEPQDLCGPFASPSEVFGAGPQVEDFESIRAPPFGAVAVLTHGDAAHADFSAHARVALVLQTSRGWWGVELGTTGPICIQARTVEESGPAWIETTTGDLRVERGVMHVTKHDRFTRNGGVKETLTHITCRMGAAGVPSCREL
jgi:hypothetical protein